MGTNTIEPHWRVDAKSVRGSSHDRLNKPNQDACAFWVESNNYPIILAISDGHGSEKSFRSDKGAKIAVEIAIKAINAFTKKFALPDFAEMENQIRLSLIPDIINSWGNLVQQDINSQPFLENEYKLLTNDKDVQNELTKVVSKNSALKVYGATLITVAVLKDYILCVQIGDGDILFVNEIGEVIPLFNNRILGVETTSLCMENSEKYFNIKILERSKVDPKLIILSTDGYSNSFKTDKDFLNIGKDYLKLIQDYGFNHTFQLIPDFLKQTSASGCGDDITLGIIKRDDLGDVDITIDLIKENLKIKNQNLNERLTEAEKNLRKHEGVLMENQKNNEDNYKRLDDLFSQQQGYIIDLNSNIKSIQEKLANLEKINVRVDEMEKEISSNKNKLTKEIKELDNKIIPLNKIILLAVIISISIILITIGVIGVFIYIR
jgi:serine/threonine protein phosphatase PrpC